MGPSGTASTGVKPASSSYRALAVAELLERILLHLDMQTLLVSAMRVCRQWSSLITTSLPLQRALFLVPDATTCCSCSDGCCSDGSSCSNRDSAKVVSNPLLARHFPPLFTPVYDIGCPFPLPGLEPEDGCYDYLFEDVSYNGLDNFKSLPVYKRSVAADDGDNGNDNGHGFTDDYEADPEHNAKVRENNPYLRECASWRNMLTSQPPATKLGFCMLSIGGNSTITRTEIFYVNNKVIPSDGAAVDADDNNDDDNAGGRSNTPPIRIGNLYPFILLRMILGSSRCGFRTMTNLRNHPRDYILQYAALPFHGLLLEWNMADEIGKLYDEGAGMVVLCVSRPLGCFLAGPDPRADAVWRRCRPENLRSRLDSYLVSEFSR